MVSNLSITFMIVSMLVSFVLPLVLVAYFYRKYKISIKAVLVGVLIFIVFSQVLEKMLHWYVLVRNPQTAGMLTNPWIYMVYGGLAAGVFEEVGRFIGFKFLLKGRTQWKDGMAYGIGHGGIESILIGGMMSLQYIVYSNLINSGMFEKTLGVKVPISSLESLKQVLTSYSPYYFGVIGLERVLAVTFHIALSLLVLYGVKNRKNIYLLYAIVIHALFDFPAALFQTGQIKNVWIVESIILVAALISLIFIIKSKYMFSKSKDQNS